MIALTQTVTWIPVGERLPKLQQMCIVALRAGAAQQHAIFRGSHFSSVPGSYEIMASRVTHWAEPLKHPFEL